MAQPSQNLDTTSTQVLCELQTCQLRNDSISFTDSLRNRLTTLDQPTAAVQTFKAIHTHLNSADFPQTAQDFREAVLADMFAITVPFAKMQSAIAVISRCILAMIVDAVSPRELATLTAECLSRAG